MRTIETTATIKPDGTIIAKGPADLPPGEHRVVIVVEEHSAIRSPKAPLRFSAYSVGPTRPGHTFRREDLYGDDGR
jgi:hypothetical protein